MAISELRELGEHVAHRRDLQKLYAAELFVLLITVTAVGFSIDAGVLSFIEGMVLLAVATMIELLVEARVTGSGRR
ncbi:hypothetical protein EIK79_05285 [Halocatena pleomorpha]|uniref:Uncharacterized protein n=2 Tax=Halocatena pleomorpha TaxID=1785090 RepID=A0A3P3RFK6_9EURY|nr:hypothetical protein EIK79_05285 [Halocatena pleomorpha]